jgi:type IV secretory pathway component VirB8
MNDESRETSESIRNGTYFAESRAWFRAVYIRPISERTFFLMVAAMAGLVGLLAIISLSALMPLREDYPVIFRAHERMEETTPRLVRLRESEELINPAMERFFVSQFVLARESYTPTGYLVTARFVYAHAMPAVYAAYQPLIDPENPSSFFQTYGRIASRKVDIDHVSTRESQGKRFATVRFSTESYGLETDLKSRWTAKLEYTYTDMQQEEVTNEETGAPDVRITEPRFQVVHYEVAPAK